MPKERFQEYYVNSISTEITMFRAGIFAVLWSLVICSFGFTMDRSECKDLCPFYWIALVLSTWDTAPSLDTYQRISVDPTLNSKIQTTDTDKSPQIENAKVMTKLTDGIKESQIREKRSSTENIGVKSIGDITSVKNDDSDFSEKDTDSITGPRNVVLLLIDNKTHDEKRRENRHDHVETLPFTVEGSLQVFLGYQDEYLKYTLLFNVYNLKAVIALKKMSSFFFHIFRAYRDSSCVLSDLITQSCSDKIGTINISSESALVSESKEKDCDCERLLYSSIGELLSWAKYTRQMATGLKVLFTDCRKSCILKDEFCLSGTVSISNLSTPLLFDYVAGPSDILTGFDGSNEGDAKLESRKNKRDSNNAWQMISLAGDRSKSVPTLLAPEAKREGKSRLY
ncbi:uncharacterized protein LOC105183479 [Harpegnathos saltator]|uniref:uncharacterized protein LOC105183479 n=1 Tax=Harpegnathos saltator TaxID=610380 RepID=UPI000DBEE00D|nr:uncharacterized protein LOC105183479 [Harpegnathos saltator]